VLKSVWGDPKLSRHPVITFAAPIWTKTSIARMTSQQIAVVKLGSPERLRELVTNIHDYWINLNEKAAA